jgi:hypothetical protein
MQLLRSKDSDRRSRDPQPVMLSWRAASQPEESSDGCGQSGDDSTREGNQSPADSRITLLKQRDEEFSANPKSDEDSEKANEERPEQSPNDAHETA